MSTPTYAEMQKISRDLVNSLPQLVSTANSMIDQNQLSAAGIEMTAENARVIGVFGGAAPGLTWGGAEAYQMVLYDRLTGETGVYIYSGVTLGPSISVPGLGIAEGGIVLFSGGLDDVSGPSFGIQGSAGINVGISTNLSMDVSMIQIGGSASIAAEVTFGYTWDLSAQIPKFDQILAKNALSRIFADDPVGLHKALVLMDISVTQPGRADEFMEKYGALLEFGEKCFLAGTEIMLADSKSKPIETVCIGDLVMSYDAAGNLVPGRVVRTFQNDAKHILDFFGLMVTPGHVMMCDAGRYAGRHVTLLDILRSDGAVVTADGKIIRAATGVEVDSEMDAEIEVVIARQGAKGFQVAQSGRLRMGTRVLLENGTDISLAELIAANGGQRTDAGLIDGPQGEAPLMWPFGDQLPAPEDYILARSAVTLADIYAANEWESAPLMRAPVMRDVGPMIPASDRIRDQMPANIPLSMRPRSNRALQ